MFQYTGDRRGVSPKAVRETKPKVSTEYPRETEIRELGWGQRVKHGSKIQDLNLILEAKTRNQREGS